MDRQFQKICLYMVLNGENTSLHSKKNSHKTMTKTVTKDTSLNDTQYPQKLHELHSKLPFFKERIKIKNCEKIVCMLYHKKNTYFYVIQIKALKKALDHGFKLNKVHKYSSLI